MILCQVEQAEKAFTETAKTFGLAVGILIFLVISLAGILWWSVRMLAHWLKPMVERFFQMHIETMESVKSSVASQSESVGALVSAQKDAASTLKEANKIQIKKLEEIKESTDQTNRLLAQNGLKQVEAIGTLAQSIKTKE